MESWAPTRSLARISRSVASGIVVKYKEDIKNKDKEISNKEGDIRGKRALLVKAEADDKHIDDQKANVKKEIAGIIGRIQPLADTLASEIKNITSPAKGDLKLLDKDPKTKNYLKEWGPALATTIKDKINKAQRWPDLKVSADVNWPQSDFAGGIRT